MITPVGKPGFSQSSSDTARGTLRIAETFVSRQGEGKLTGTSSFFIRTSGCNLRCWFCDTPYASWNPQGQSTGIGELIQAARESQCSHVVLTGGEPLLPDAIVPLCDDLRSAGLHVTIETAGTIDRPVSCDLLSLSPKFASSAPSQTEHPRWHRLQQDRRMPLGTMAKLIERADDFQLKFVVDDPRDFDELVDIVDRLGADAGAVWVMPQGSDLESMDRAKTWLAPWVESVGYHYCDRMQIRWYGNRRGT